MKYSFIIIVVIVLFGCNKEWLDIKNDKLQSVPATLKDFQSLMDNMAAMNGRQIGLGEIGADGHHVTEQVWNSADIPARNAYTWSHEGPYPSDGAFWGTIYSRVFLDNIVLDGLKKMETSSLNEADKAQFDNIRGQALFNRAMAFWNLAQHYSLSFDAATASRDLGIAVRLTSDITEPTKRASVRDTYEIILNDLKQCVDILPESTNMPTRPTKRAVFAMLARVYLSIREYNNALLYSDKCLQFPYSLLKFSELSLTASVIGQFNVEVIFHDLIVTSSVSSFLTTRYLIDRDLYDLYDNNDLRKRIYFRNSNGNITFKGNYNINTSSLFCGLAVDEILLIRAECYARSGNKDKAMQDLNTLMIARWEENGSWQPFQASDAGEALRMILSERRKELILRGLRWSDLRRLNKDEVFKTIIERTIGGKKYTLLPDSYKYTFPIPQDIILRTNVEQTPGW